jgi:putative ABC transport system permease protein
MIRSYLKVAVRNFNREKFYSFLNVFGLSVGIAVALVIVLFIVQETSYDRFHGKAARIFRIAMHLEIAGSVTDMNATFPGMAEALTDEMGEVEKSTRVYSRNGRVFKKQEKVFSEDNVVYTDPDFFDVFDFTLLAGNRKTALAKPNAILLTPALAAKYFDSQNWSEIIGESISVNQEVYEVTGIVADAPANSHFAFTAIASIATLPQGKTSDWDNLNVSTYLLLRKPDQIGQVISKIPAVFAKHMPNYDKLPESGIVMQPIPQALTDIHLHSNIQGEFKPAGSLTNIYIFGSVAIGVLLLACVNFVNLVTARSARRAKEVGVRKVLGSTAFHVMKQFIAESIVMVFLSTLLALGFVELLRAPLTLFLEAPLPFEILLTPGYLILLLSFILVLGLSAGSYPAFYLSSFKPAQVLKGKVRLGFRTSGLRNFLVCIQFTISIILISCTLIVQRQLDFMRSKKLGFDKENVIVIDNANKLRDQATFINALKGISSVDMVGASTFRPVDDYDGIIIESADDKTNRKLVNFSRVDHAYMDVLRYEFVEGRNFSMDFPSDSAAVVINERAAEFLFGGNALGKKIHTDINYTVIGVVKDFHFESLKNEVRPLVFYLRANQRFLHVRIRPGNYQETIAIIEKEWKQVTSEIPFSYSFLSDTYDSLYKQEIRMGWIFNVFTGLALLIACLGLIGLAAYTAEQRKKELSVRKVLGASPAMIVALLSKDFIRIIAIAVLFALPLAYYLMLQWLKSFAFKVDIPWHVLAMGGLLVLFVALLVVSYQSVRAALVNPVDSLKEE